MAAKRRVGRPRKSSTRRRTGATRLDTRKVNNRIRRHKRLIARRAAPKKRHGNAGVPKSRAHRAAISAALRKYHRSRKRSTTRRRSRR